MTAFEYLKSLPHLPCDNRNNAPSKAELRRWLNSGSVTINGKRPGPADEIDFPIHELVYFKGAKRQTTVIMCGHWWRQYYHELQAS